MSVIGKKLWNSCEADSFIELRCQFIYLYIFPSVCLSPFHVIFFRPLIGPQITWSDPGLSLVDPPSSLGPPWVFLGFPRGFPEVFLGFSQGFPGFFPGFSPGFPWVFPGFSLGFPWVFPGFSRGFPGIFLGFSQGFPRVFPGFSWGFPVVFRGFSWGFPGVFPGFPRGFPGVFPGFFGGFPGVFPGFYFWEKSCNLSKKNEINLATSPRPFYFKLILSSSLTF